MAFFYGSKDSKGAQAAQTLYDDLKRQARDKLDLTRLREKDTKLAGSELLKKEFNTIDDLSAYLEKVMQRRGTKAPFQREVDNGAPARPLPFWAFGFALR